MDFHYSICSNPSRSSSASERAQHVYMWTQNESAMQVNANEFIKQKWKVVIMWDLRSSLATFSKATELQAATILLSCFDAKILYSTLSRMIFLDSSYSSLSGLFGCFSFRRKKWNSFYAVGCAASIWPWQRQQRSLKNESTSKVREQY